jgi:hypothetical protein
MMVVIASLDLLMYRLQNSQRPLTASTALVVPGEGVTGTPPPVLDEKELQKEREKEWPRCVNRLLARRDVVPARPRADAADDKQNNGATGSIGGNALVPSSSSSMIENRMTASASAVTGIEPTPGISFPIISSSPFIELTPTREDPVRRGQGRIINGQLQGKAGRLQPRQFLFGSCWLTNRWQCFPPEVKSIDFYTQTDKTLGQFLRENCFDLKLRCLNAKVTHHNAFLDTAAECCCSN